MRDIVSYVFAFVTGLVFGSFANVLIYRPIAGLKLNEPRFSICPRCGARIRWYDNVPLLSYVLLRGRCRHCGGRISARYPIVELTYGLVFLLNALLLPPDLAIAMSAIFTVSLPAFLIDLKIMMLPDYTWATVLVVAIYLSLTHFRETLILDVAGGVLTLMVMLLLKIRYKEGIGEGDLFLFPTYALAAGLMFTPVFMLGSSLSGLIYGAVKRKAKVPFGPFIIAWGYTLVMLRALFCSEGGCGIIP